jgi:hypothetical protein
MSIEDKKIVPPTEKVDKELVAAINTVVKGAAEGVGKSLQAFDPNGVVRKDMYEDADKNPHYKTTIMEKSQFKQ